MSDWNENKKANGLESEYNTKGMIIGGAVLVVIILVLCFLIWKLYHKDEGSISGNNSITQSSEGESDTLGSGHGDEGDTLSSGGTQDADETESSGAHEGQGGSQVDTQEGQDGSQDASSAGQGSENQGGGQGGQSDDPGEGTESDTPSMDFADVDETVTAKETTNLRSAPGTTGDDTVVTKLRNGETAKRTGINEEMGWSRLEYNGQTLYAVSRLLTTDLSDKPEEKPSNTVTTAGGRKITFTPCDDVVSPKIECNLRTEPSTDQGEQTVSYLLKYGEKVHRTGYDADSGWSRVEYNGATLYLVSSLVYVVEETPESEDAQ